MIASTTKNALGYHVGCLTYDDGTTSLVTNAQTTEAKALEIAERMKAANIRNAVAALPDWMTEAQKAAYAKLQARWARVAAPQKEICGAAALCECFYGAGGSIWVGIEPDGYTHS